MFFFLACRPQNMIAQSQSGTGKTAAFVLAMLSRANLNKNYPHIICLSPTCELAIQTGVVLQKMAKFMPEIKVKLAIRGVNCNFRINFKLIFFKHLIMRFVFIL